MVALLFRPFCSMCRGEHAQALQELAKLSFIPTERFRLQLCVAGVLQLHPNVADRLPAIIVAGVLGVA